MKEIKKIGVLSAAKIQAIMMALFGLLLGLFYALISASLGASANSLGLGAKLGALAIVILPILYAVFGFIAGAVGAFIYNLAAKWIGGLEIELSEPFKSF